MIAGKTGFAVLDTTSFQVVRTVPFERTLPPSDDHWFHSRIYDLDGDDRLEFLRVPRWRGPASLHGGDGRAEWVDKGLLEFVDVGDTDADGKLELWITERGKPGVRKLDHAGKLVFRQEWNPWSMRFSDIDADGRRDVVYVEPDGLWARDSEGKVLAHTALPRRGCANRVFVIRAWADPDKTSLIAGEYEGIGRGSIQYDYAVNSDAKSIGPAIDFEQASPLINAKPVSFDGIPAAWSETSPISRPAPIAGVSATRLRLRMFDSSGTIVYEEIIRPPDGETAGSEGACLFRAAERAQPAQLFVAYGTVVWRYTARP